MRNLLAGLIVVLCPLSAFSESLLVSPEAAYASEGGAAENVRNECNLPAAQTEYVLNALSAAGVSASAASDDAVPGKGRFLRLRIESPAAGQGAALDALLARLARHGERIHVCLAEGVAPLRNLDSSVFHVVLEPGRLAGRESATTI